MSDPMTLLARLGDLTEEVAPLQQEILQHLVAAGTARGWFPSVDKLVERFSDGEKEADVREAIEGLKAHELLVADDDGTIDTIIGGITHRKTDFRATSLADSVRFHLRSSLDALTIAPLLQKAVTVHTTCPVSEDPIRVDFGEAAEITASEPYGFTAFANAGELGRFFRGDAELESWTQLHGDPDGMPLTQDTIRFVGAEMAQAIAALYVHLSVR